jgi:hypothetical protein
VQREDEEGMEGGSMHKAPEALKCQWIKER